MEKSKLTIPESLFSKLYDRTGYHAGGNKGFFIFYVDSSGNPTCAENFENQATRMAVKGGIKNFLKEEKRGEEFFADFQLDD
jgi:hypothetical protein